MSDTTLMTAKMTGDTEWFDKNPSAPVGNIPMPIGHECFVCGATEDGDAPFEEYDMDIFFCGDCAY